MNDLNFEERWPRKISPDDKKSSAIAFGHATTIEDEVDISSYVCSRIVS